jgi:hypothetical protein
VGTGFDAFAVGAKRGLGKPGTFNFFGVHVPLWPVP